MSLDADAIVDRRRMRRKLTFWRVGAVLIALLALVGLAAALVPGSRLLPRGDYIARIKIAGPDPRQPGPRRGARAAGQVARPRRDRAYRQPRRHHRRLASSFTTRCARLQAKKPMVVVVDGLAASGAYIAALSCRPHHRAGHLAGRLDRRAVPVSELHRRAQDDRHPGRGDQILAAQGRAERLRADQPGSARRHRGDRARLLCLVQGPGEGPPPDGRCASWRAVADGRVFTGRQGVGLKLVDDLGNEKTALTWLEKEKKVPANTPVRDVLAGAAIQRAFLPACRRLDLRGGRS